MDYKNKVRYGYVKNRVFYGYPSLDRCRAALKSPSLFRKQDEFEIVKFKGTGHSPNKYDSTDELVGFVYLDAMTGATVRYQSKNGKMSYEIAPDGSLKRAGSYEVIF